MTTQSKSLRFADQFVKSPYAWPGGYPLFALMDDGGALCKKCAASERELIGTTTGHDGWCIKALVINYEDPGLRCSHCSRHIDSAYF